MAARRIGARKLIDEWVNTGPGWKVGPVFGFVVVWLIPVQLVVLLGWWLYQSITVADPDGWWNPLRANSFGTAVCQWSLALLACFFLNSFLTRPQKEIP